MSRSLKVLGIETSTARAEIALALDDRLLAQAVLPEHTRPTAQLVPAIEQLCRSLAWSPGELDLVCVDQGPGSYTGLRVGMTCAKTLAFATGAALATAGALEIVAAGAAPDAAVIDVAFDAARGQVFAARYVRGDGALRSATALHLAEFDDWIAALCDSSLVTGPALAKYRDRIAPSRRVADSSQWWPRAAELIRLALAAHRSAPRNDYFTLEPLYLRPSAAEEKRATRTRVENKN